MPLGAREPFRTGDKRIYLQAGAAFVLRARALGGQTGLEDMSVAQKGEGDQGRGVGGLGQDRQPQGMVLGEVFGEPARGCGAVSPAGEEAPRLRDPSPPPRHLSPALWTSKRLSSLSLRNNRRRLSLVSRHGSQGSSESYARPPAWPASGTDRQTRGAHPATSGGVCTGQHGKLHSGLRKGLFFLIFQVGSTISSLLRRRRILKKHPTHVSITSQESCGRSGGSWTEAPDPTPWAGRGQG